MGEHKNNPTAILAKQGLLPEKNKKSTFNKRKFVESFMNDKLKESYLWKHFTLIDELFERRYENGHKYY